MFWATGPENEASIVDQVGPGTPARSLPLWYPSCCGKAPQGSHVILPQRSLTVSPSYRQALTEGLQWGGGLCKRQLQSPLCALSSEQQPEGAGKAVPFISSPFVPLMGLHLRTRKLDSFNCLCSLTGESIKRQGMFCSVTRLCSLQLKQALKNARGSWSAGRSQQSNCATERGLEDRSRILLG